MNILICSDGTPASDGAAHLGGMLARATKAPVTLLGIVENPADDQPLRQALDRETGILRQTGVELRTVIQTGEPTAQILGRNICQEVRSYRYRLAPAERVGRFLAITAHLRNYQSSRTAGLGGDRTRERMSRILLCSGGKHFIDDAMATRAADHRRALLAVKRSA